MTRILVIDDDKAVGFAIEAMLADQGWGTVCALDANSGVRAFESSKFDVVMIDIFMPGTDGLKTIKRLLDQSPMLPIVAMSGLRYRDPTAPVPDFLAMAAALGATCCLRKPFVPQQLVAAINTCLQSTVSKNKPVGKPMLEQGSSGSYQKNQNRVAGT